MRMDYRGHRSIGFCQKNFHKLESIPDDAVIDLNLLNNHLTAVNQLFVDEFSVCIGLRPRFSVGEALLLDLNFP